MEIFVWLCSWTEFLFLQLVIELALPLFSMKMIAA